MKPMLLAVFAAFFVSAHAEDVNLVAKATYAAVDRATVHRNIKAFDEAMRPHLAPNFKAVAGGRDVTYKDLLRNFRAMFVQIQQIDSSTTSILISVVKGKTATMKVHDELRARVKGPDRKMHRVELTNTSEDVWQKYGSTWKLTSTTTLSESRRIDGKLQKPI